MHENRVYYTLEDANELIPTLEYLFGELARIQQRIGAMHSRAAELGVEIDVERLKEEGETSNNKVKRQLEEHYISLSEEYADRLEEIFNLGVVVDDLDQGIVNFYSWIDGMEVFFSWQFGEREILHWHEVTENSIARKSLGTLVTRAPSEALLH